MKIVRKRHSLIQEYDRQTIVALKDRISALQSTHLTELSVDNEVLGCSGEQLSVLRNEAHEVQITLYGFLNVFNHALASDPQGAFIDDPAQ